MSCLIAFYKEFEKKTLSNFLIIIFKNIKTIV